MDDSDYSTDTASELGGTMLDDPRLPGADGGGYDDVDIEAFPRGGGRPPQNPMMYRYDDNRAPRREVYLPDDDPLKEPARSTTMAQYVFDALKMPLLIAVVFLVFESNPVRNMAIRTLPIGVSFDGQLDFVGLLILALLAGIVVSFSARFIDRQMAF